MKASNTRSVKYLERLIKDHQQYDNELLEQQLDILEERLCNEDKIEKLEKELFKAKLKEGKNKKKA